MKQNLIWSVDKNEDGSFVRRKLNGDGFDMDYIDVIWTYTKGFPPDYEMLPVGHPPHIKYEKKITGVGKTMIQDQISVTAEVADSTVAMILDEKRVKLARSYGIDL